jgi:hypothetical protein
LLLNHATGQVCLISRSRRTAALSGFFSFTQSVNRPDP